MFSKVLNWLNIFSIVLRWFYSHFTWTIIKLLGLLWSSVKFWFWNWISEHLKFTCILLRDMQACFYRCILFLTHFVSVQGFRFTANMFKVTAWDPVSKHELAFSKQKQAWYEVWTLITNSQGRIQAVNWFYRLYFETNLPK